MHHFAVMDNLLLDAVPVITVPIAQQHAQISPDALVFHRPFGLFFQAAQARFQLAEDIQHALQVAAGGVQPVERFFAPGAVQPNPGGFLEEPAPLLWFERQRRIHQPLTDDRVGALGQPGAAQQLGDFLQAHALPVEQVFVLPIPVRPAGDRNLVEVNRQPAVFVVKRDRRGSHPGPRAHLRPGKDHILGLAPAQQRIRLLAQHPAQRIGDVRLARTVRANDRGDIAGEFKHRPAGKGFISVQFE